MATISPPILIWSPGGGTPPGVPPVEPPAGRVAGESGITILIEDQSWIDVVFVTAQPRSDWTFIELQVVNTTDAEPLNIWPGVVTHKTKTGFRLQLNGLPDSGNYVLDWTIGGSTTSEGGIATEYTFSGPETGPLGSATAFVVALPAGTSLDEAVTITPNDAGAGGTFAPVNVLLSTDVPSANFNYTPVSYGDKVISVTNDQAMPDPSSIAFTVVASTYTLTGPSSGTVGVASTNFTVALPVGGVVVGTVTVTPNDAGVGTAGTFTPATVTLTTAAPSATFTYTPATVGTKTISVTNNKGMTNPASLSYNSIVAPIDPSTIAGLKLWLKADSLALSDGTLVATWTDSSGLVNNATAPGGRQPTFKTNIVNSLPIVRTTAGKYMDLTTAISGVSPWVVFAVMKAAAAVDLYSSLSLSADLVGPTETAAGTLVVTDRAKRSSVANSWTGGFHVFTGKSVSGVTPDIWVDGTLQVVTSSVVGSTSDFTNVCAGTGDIAEILIYNVALSTTDRQAVEYYLKTKYATP